jgi:hypothetical protein
MLFTSTRSDVNATPTTWKFLLSIVRLDGIAPGVLLATAITASELFGCGQCPLFNPKLSCQKLTSNPTMRDGAFEESDVLWSSIIRGVTPETPLIVEIEPMSDKGTVLFAGSRPTIGAVF